MLPVADAHCDALSLGLDRPALPPVVTLARMRAGGVALQVLALFAGAEPPPQGHLAFAKAQLERFAAWQAAGLGQVDDPSAIDGQQPWALLSVEGGEILEDRLENLTWLRGQGVRMLGLVWNRENELAFPAITGSTEGIKPFGWAVLSEMGRQRIAADVSHLNEAGFWQLMDRHPHPALASHSNCAALCPHPRNLTDAQIRALCQGGGWIGINLYPPFLKASGQAALSDVVAHIDHIADLGFVNHVGMGSDFDGIDDWTEGLAGPEDFPNLWEALQKRGYPDEVISAIACGNFLRYFERLNRG